MIVPLTPLMFLRRAEKLFPQKVGVVCEGLRFSYAEFGSEFTGFPTLWPAWG